MRQLVIFIFLLAGILFVGCRGPQVAFRDMDPKPTASIVSETLTVHLGVITNIPVSEVWIGHSAKIVDRTVSITGYQSFYHEQSRDFVIRLPASVTSQTVSVVWIEPDGNHVPIPITK